MAVQHVGDMSLDELRKLINETVDRRLAAWQRPAEKRTMAEVLASIEKNRIVPLPGEKSAREMLRDDRDA